MTTATRQEADTSDAPDEWIVLAAANGGAAAGDHNEPRTRDAVLQVGIIALVLVALVALVGSLVVSRLAEQQSVHDVAELTDVLAQSVVQPALTDAMADDSAVAARVLDPVIRRGVLSSTLIRVKLWTPAGTVLYSDEARLVGRTFALDPEASAALEAPRIEADVSNLSRPENRFERGDGKLLEVYRPVWTPQGRPLLLETYFRYDTVHERSAGLWRGFAGIMISSIVALLALLVPLVAFLLRKTRKAHEQREAMAQRAVDASDEERRRIGASLHDGVVQQLVAASFDIAGRAEHAAAAGASEHARVLGEVAATVRGTIGGLRSLLVEIYPPSLGAAGLSAALRDLSGAAAGGEVRIRIDIDEAAERQLPGPAQEDVFRVAQECLRNAAKHSGAQVVDVRLLSRSDGRVRLEIEDDGTGFDVAEATSSAAAGHLGLQLMAHAAQRCGAELAVASRPGHGTRFRMDVPSS